MLILIEPVAYGTLASKDTACWRLSPDMAESLSLCLLVHCPGTKAAAKAEEKGVWLGSSLLWCLPWRSEATSGHVT